MRALVYVNINPTQKHITIHCEENNPCSVIFQQILSGNANPKCNIQQLSNDKSVIKIGETDNSFWLLIWVKDIEDCRQLINHPEIQNIANKHGIQNITIHHC